MTNEDTVKEQGRRASMRAILGNRDYRILWSGRAMNMLGAQFTMIATPWLVLQLTGSALAMGTVMAVSGIPRAAFMLVGGAVTDRISPRLIMIVNSIAFAVILSLESALVLNGLIVLWMLYAFALITGALDAFYFPAVTTTIPQLVDKRDLPSANALVQGTVQACMFLGPVVAGGLIALLSGTAATATGSTEASPDLNGIGIAFAINAVTFAVSAFLFWRLRIPKRRPQPGQAEQHTGMLSSIREGMAFVWKDRSLRAVFILYGLVSFFTVGPIAIGIPVLADSRFTEGAVAFGIIMSGFGGGALLGILFVLTLPDPAAKNLGPIVRNIVTLQGMCLVLLAFAPSMLIAAVATFAMGLGNGYMNVMMITWFQRRTPLPMLGRCMSLLMFAMTGLQPFSMALAGFAVQLNAVAAFVTAGAFVALLAQSLGRRASINEMGIR